MQSELTSESIIQRLQYLLPALQQRYGVATLALFGSYLRGDATSASDIDILVTFQHPPTLWELISLENELSDRFGKPVDLVLQDSLKPHIGELIRQEMLVA